MASLLTPPSPRVALNAYERMADAWALTAEDSAVLLGVSARTVHRWFREHCPDQLRSDTLERISHLIAIWDDLAAIFGRGEPARSWLKRDNADFGGSRPYSACYTDTCKISLRAELSRPRPSGVVDVHRVVPDPRNSLAALADLVEQPEDLEELLALRALTDPLAADALTNVSLVSPADRYLGPRASVVMAPFLIIGQSRFSPGTFGVLYTADEFIVAVREIELSRRSLSPGSGDCRSDYCAAI